MRTLQCVIVDDDDLSRDVVERNVERVEYLEAIGPFGDAVEAASFLRANQTDVLFLDVEMPEMTGLELVETLASPPVTVLVTGKEQYAVESYDYDVADFLLKPFSHARFLKAAARAKELHARRNPELIDNRFLFAKIDAALVKIDLRAVERVEAKGDYVEFHTDEGRRIVYSTMKHVEARLPAEEFARVHRSHIVRLDRVKDVAEGNLVVGKAVVPVGASYRDALLLRLNIL